MTLWMIAIAAIAFASDQASKFVVSRYLDPHSSIDVIPSFFQLSLVHNHGAAFGILSGVDEPIRSIALISLSVAAFAILIYLYIQRPAGDRLVACSIALISGGGNRKSDGSDPPRVRRRFSGCVRKLLSLADLQCGRQLHHSRHAVDHGIDVAGRKAPACTLT